jgi:hypothetical protein
MPEILEAVVTLIPEILEAVGTVIPEILEAVVNNTGGRIIQRTTDELRLCSKDDNGICIEYSQ